MEEVIYWWCTRFRLHKPYKASKNFQIYQSDALYYLRSELRNGKGLTLLQYAAVKGVCGLVKAMIWVEDIFVTPLDNSNDENSRIMINVTNFMPHITSKNVKYLKGRNYLSFGQFNQDSKTFDDIGSLKSLNEEKEPFMNRRCGCGTCGLKFGRCVSNCCGFVVNVCYHDYPKQFHEVCDEDVNEQDDSLLEAFLKIKPSNKASEVMAIEPLKTMVRDYWFVHQWCMVIMLTLHLIHMSYYTIYCMDTVSKAFSGGETHTSPTSNQTSHTTELTPNYVFLIWPIAMMHPKVISVIYVSRNLFCLMSRVGRKGFNRYCFGPLLLKNYQLENYIDVKDFFKLPSFFLSLFIAFLPSFLPWIFFGFSLAALLSTSYGAITFTRLTICSVLVGWLMTFYWASSFESVYRFVTALHHIILKDVISFLIFYVFVLLAFSSAIYLLFQMVPELSEEYTDLNDVMYELLLLGCTADSRISASDISEKLRAVGRSPLGFHFLFASYIVIIMVLFLNLIIATMTDTYTKLSGTEQNGWRQHSLALSRSFLINLISLKILRPMFSYCRITDRNLVHNEMNGHYYMTMSRQELRKYRLQNIY